MPRKFIIEGEDLKLGIVEYHKELAIDKKNVNGGGWFYIDKDHTFILFYFTSMDFGSVSFDQIKKVKESMNFRLGLEEFEWRFSSHEFISDAVKDYKVI